MADPGTGAWRRIEALLHEALALSPNARTDFLTRHCQDEPALLREVHSLLEAADAPAGALAVDAAASIAPTRPAIPEALPELALGARLGSYRIVGLIGSGGMGEVYRGERADGLFEKSVAIKLLRPEAVEHLRRFETERQIVARLDHPGIARLLDGGSTADGRPYMVMDYIAGTSLAAHCQHAALGLDARLALFAQVCAAVSHAHEQGVIHRDLKPDNILVDRDGRVRLLDFGIAKIGELNQPLTATAAPMTLAYAAPEQLSGKTPSPATDVHALGVILYELLSGQSPWRVSAQTPASLLMQRILQENPAAPSQAAHTAVSPGIAPSLLSGDLDAIVLRCLRKAPEQRYATVAVLVEDLERCRRGEALSQPSRAPSNPNTDDAERRQLSVLFCDLAGSTALSDQMDPEAFRELILNYQSAVAAVATRQAGHIAQYLGDGVLIYFGYPSAAENDAERAVRCGYDIVQAIKRLPQLPPVQVRIGIHTGPVVIGAMNGREALAMGATTNIAARLQALAEPDAVLISAHTRKLVPGLFVLRELGEQALKGIDKPLALFQVVQPSGVSTRLEAAQSLTPFIGRTQERALLADRWEQTQEGQGQAVLITAEPGLGKSRLLLAFRESIQDSSHSWLDCRCAPSLSGSAFAPLIELLLRGLQFKEGDGNAQRIERLERAIDLIGQERTEALPLLAPLLGLSLAKPYQPSPYGPELRRKKLLNLLCDWVLALSRQQPLLLVVEDLHWADPSSLDLLHLLVERIPGQRLMLLLTTRPDYRAPWPGRTHTAHLILQGLRNKESLEVLRALCPQALTPALEEKILKRAGGVPLFLEELVHDLRESGKLGAVVSLDTLEIPATLQDSLTARLDRLGEAKSLIQLCALIGREVPQALLPHVAELEPTALQAQLDQLVASQLLHASGSGTEAAWVFRHALIRDCAYNSLLKSRRQLWHGRVAVAMEMHCKDLARREPQILAAHYEQAGNPERALHHYRLACEHSERRASFPELMAWAERGLSLIGSLPEGRPRTEMECALLNALIRGTMVVKGVAHAGLRSITEHALVLARELQDSAAIARLLTMSWSVRNFSGEFREALRYADAMVAEGRKLGLKFFEATGLSIGSTSRLLLGELQQAHDDLEKAIRLGENEWAGSRMFAQAGGADPICTGYATLGLAKSMLGLRDQAERHWALGLQRADKLGAIEVICIVRAFIHTFRVMTSEAWQESFQALKDTYVLCEKHGQITAVAFGSYGLAMAHCRAGDTDLGFEWFERALEAFARIEHASGFVRTYAMLAAMRLQAGHLPQAEAALAQAFHYAEQQEQYFWLAEMHRLRALLLQAQGAGSTEVEAHLHSALEVARRQGALILELRAATSLATLWQSAGRGKDGLALLQSVYACFTEGFEVPDMQAAAALIHTLSSTTL